MSDTTTDEATVSSGSSRQDPATPLASLRDAVLQAAAGLGSASQAGEPTTHDREQGGQAPTAAESRSVTIERPRRPEFGDYSTNAAMALAPALGQAPRAIAEQLAAALAQRLGDSLERVDVAGPGFLNLFLADSWMRSALAQVLAAGDRYGGATATTARVLVEFVSANPTGPMHVGHARNAAYGDSLARMLEFHGSRVEREFYVNDAGSQIRKFGESIQALASGEDVPEDGYRGDYVAELVAHVPGAPEMDPVDVGRAAIAVMIDRMRGALARFNVCPFDHWQYESTLYQGDPSPVAHVLSLLEQLGHTYTNEGALWLRSSEFGDDKDRVLVRSNGEHTYFASDIAYHQDKRERGFERQINVWGADHHGYVQRMKAAYAALGGDPDELELLIMQFVHLVRSGERAQMSKRAGEFVTLEDLVDEIGVDAARWFLLARSHDTTVDLDLDLAREQSKENPVYYVQYAHARIASMLARAGEAEVAAALAAASEPAREDGPPLHENERALIAELLSFPGEVADGAQRRAPHRIAAYALQLAQVFTAFYRDCRVIGAEPAQVQSFRIALCVAAQRTLAVSLGLLGVSAPEHM
jgi:arginyl-tRNA synthetase